MRYDRSAFNIFYEMKRSSGGVSAPSVVAPSAIQAWPDAKHVSEGLREGARIKRRDVRPFVAVVRFHAAADQGTFVAHRAVT